MNKRINKILAVMAMAPCALFATACGGNQLDEEQAYNSLKTAINETVSYDGSVSSTINSNISFDTYSYSTTIEMGYNKETGEYYEITKAKENDEEHLDESNFVRKGNDDNYYLYECKGEKDYDTQEYSYEYNKYIVSSDHAVNAFLSDDSSMIDSDEMDEMVYIFKDYESFKSLKDNFVNDLADELLEQGIDYNVKVAKATMSENKGTYALKIQLAVEVVTPATDTEPQITTTTSLEIEFKTKDDKLTGFDFVYGITRVNGVGDEAEENTLSANSNVVISYSYIDKLIANESNYPLESKKLTSEVTYYIDNQNFNSEFFEFGDTIQYNVTPLEHTTIEGWYLDKECTIKFTATQMPSYDLNLYAKSKADEGYAVIVYEYTYKIENVTRGNSIATVVVAMPEGETSLELLIPAILKEASIKPVGYTGKISKVNVNGENITINPDEEVKVTINELGYYLIKVESQLTEDVTE
ncbi:MAG: hypothetical protein ACI4PF_01035 [Christensenellales bacterium]